MVRSLVYAWCNFSLYSLYTYAYIHMYVHVCIVQHDGGQCFW
uniref:Uncharacterized protein n=1 Tax=Rhizophora mucronata TaxID=61149 RepID=A0A2P2R0J9_RHIMU